MMMERLFKTLPILLLFGAFIVHCSANPDLILSETFDEPIDGRWTLPDPEEYTGVWKRAKSDGHDDYGLLVSTRARKYGLVKELDRPISLTDGRPVVLQFEVRLQKGLSCGGAYLKFLQPQKPGWTPKDFNENSPYSIMFGPDKCGVEKNKVHFIYRHRNPKTGKYSEHHLKTPPVVPSFDNFTHVYTAILKPGFKVWILVDGIEKRKASFRTPEDFDPPLFPTETIPDPKDKKPKDWDERPKIRDPNAVKPEDWDENAPMDIPDEEAVMPEGWLEEEPMEIDDPDAMMPVDWDEEEDGKWEAPRIMNPKCELAPGCGKWVRPTKRNPAYKGKWKARLIENPNYRGKWKARRIPNPDYFELEKLNIEPISAVAIDIWTMQDGALFDNILVTRKEIIAKSYRDKYWLPKYEVEKLKAEAAKAGGNSLSEFQVAMFEFLHMIPDIPFLSSHRRKIKKFIEKAEKQPNLTTGVVVSVLVLLLSIFLKIFLGGNKHSRVKGTKSKKGSAAYSDGMDSSGESEKEEDDAPRKRSAKKAN